MVLMAGEARCFRLAFTTQWSTDRALAQQGEGRILSNTNTYKCPNVPMSSLTLRLLSGSCMTRATAKFTQKTVPLTHFCSSVRWKRLASLRNVGWPKDLYDCRLRKCPKNQLNTTRISRGAHQTLCSDGYNVFLGNIIVRKRKEKMLKWLYCQPLK